MNWKQELIAVAGSLIFALPTFGQGGTGGTGAASTAGSGDARASSEHGAHAMGTPALLGMLHRSNQDEIDMANLAKERSSNKAVKDYADMIVSDHRKADDEVLSFARTHNIDLKQDLHAMGEEHKDRVESAARSREVHSPTGEYAKPMTDQEGVGGAGMAREHKKALDDLSKLKGSDFDRQFAKTMANDHQRVVSHLKTIRSNANTDQAVTQLIDKLLPTLEKHESSAKQLENTLSKSS